MRKSLIAVVAMSLVAGAAVGQETTVRPDINGKPTRIPVAKTFDECVAGGLKLGHPRIGPGGKDDPRGAVGFCRRFPR